MVHVWCQTTRQVYQFRLGIDSIVDAVRRSRLRWFGHVERKGDEDWVKRCRNMEVDGRRA